ncbi:MAG: trypsin-like peptidase domain-containing protein, partial [Flammeovirgaceae bacterium]|nr:trypsin-like peptidase domain-containing protein [Flammeovirgaceae bacterium]MDW8288748.1 trypsin-like peptidase domain-containing protein [Flammeovirgaceae bacterium]
MDKNYRLIVSWILSSLVGAFVMFLLIEKPSSYRTRNVLLDTSSIKTLVPCALNFEHAAAKVIPAVVHIHTTFKSTAASYGKSSIEELFKNFFGEKPRMERHFSPRASSGSGVILTEDGYIATNYHVIDGASRIEVMLEDKRRFEATVVGTDASTDLALLKIDGKGLPFVVFGDSDKLTVGQWVLAIGNPFDLTSTVTAGIVSAKARKIDLLNSYDFAVESFIQTDAVVNPGNSGGALVDLDGRLVGINTAIATHTGSYSGHSFAIPATLVQKVVDDLVKYGEVRRALMGVTIAEVDAHIAQQQKLDKIEGVLVTATTPNGSAEKAGIKPGDIILAVDDYPINATSELQEHIARHRPDENVRVMVRRGNEKITFIVRLKSKEETISVAKNTST